MRKRSRLDEKIQETRADFLLNDADIALTMLDLADVTRLPEMRVRRRRVAAQAYRTIRRFIPRSVLTEEQHAILDQKLSIIRNRLRNH